MTDKENAPFQTDSLILAASLLSLGIPLLGNEAQTPRRLRFLFEQDERVEETQLALREGRLRLEVSSLIGNYQMLKGIIVEHLRAAEGDE